MHNPNARVAQNYSILEDLGQTACLKSDLKVLQTCPTQRNALLATLGAHDLSSLSVIKFETVDVQPHFP